MKNNIGISVSEVLQIPLLQDAVVLAGESGLQRTAASVNVMEVPDIVNWVSPGELLITTAHSIKDNVSILLEMLPLLNRRQVAGLGIKFKRYIDRLPDEVLRLADTLSFPIFEIPHDIGFSEIISEVLTSVVNRQNRVLQEIQDLHHALASTMLSGGDLHVIAQMLHQRFGNSVAIISDIFSSFVLSAPPERFTLISNILEREKGQGRLHADAPPHFAPYRVWDDDIGGAPCLRIVIPICSDNTPYGNIYMWEDAREISSVEQSVIESASSLIALEMVKKASMLDMENTHRTGFLEDLLSGERKRLQRALLNAYYFDFNPDAEHLVMVLKLRSAGGSPTDVGRALYHMNSSVALTVKRAAKASPFKILFSSQGDSILMLCESPASGRENRRAMQQAFVEELAGQLKRDSLYDMVALGIGRSYAQPSRLYRSLAEARCAAASPCGVRDGTAFFEDIGVYRILGHEALRPELAVFHGDMLGTLLKYDQEKDSELVRTLAAYFHCKGNLTRLAEHLDVHYNTIVYRMQRIRELSGLNLDDEEQLLNLQIALKINEMKNNA